MAGSLNVLAFGADPFGVRDSSFAINQALAAFAAADSNVCLTFPPGEYLITSPLALTFTVPASTKNKSIRGDGATIRSAIQTATPAFLVRAHGSEVRGLAIRGLRMEGGGSETSLLTLDGSGAGSALYNVVLDGFSAEGTHGMALNAISIFESILRDVWVASLSTAVNAVYIQSGEGNNTSSLTLDNMTTRGGLNGLETDLATGEVRVQNSTFLTAQQFGAKFNFCCGVALLNNHAEDNWLGAKQQTAEQAGIMVACGGVVIGGNFYCPPGGKQGSAVRVYAVSGKTISVSGIEGQGMLVLVYADGQPGGTVRLAGQCATSHASSGVPRIYGEGNGA